MEYQSIQQIISSEKYPFTVGQMRTFLLDREKNGLSKAVRRIGKRLYIRTDLFDEWIDGHSDINKETQND